MKTDLVTMSTPELERLAVMRRIGERRTTQREAAAQLGLGLRQVERLYALYKADGAPGLVSKRRGAASNRRLPAELRTTTLGIVRTMYAMGSGGTLTKSTRATINTSGSRARSPSPVVLGDVRSLASFSPTILPG